MEVMTQPRLVLRTCKGDMTSHGGFRWPMRGYVEAPVWEPGHECGNGLHGLLEGQGNGSLLIHDDGYEWWLVVSVEDAALEPSTDKVRFPSGRVDFCGSMRGALAYMAARGVDMGRCVYGSASQTGDMGSASQTGDMGSASIKGEDGAAVSVGMGGMVRGGIGCLLAARNEDGWAYGVVGRDGLEPDVWYVAIKGILVAKEGE